MDYCWQGVSLPLHTLVEISEVDTYSLFAVGLRNRDHPITPLSWLFHLLYHLQHFHSFQLLLCCFLKGNGQSAWSIECKWLSVLLQLDVVGPFIFPRHSNSSGKVFLGLWIVARFVRLCSQLITPASKLLVCPRGTFVGPSQSRRHQWQSCFGLLTSLLHTFLALSVCVMQGP